MASTVANYKQAENADEIWTGNVVLAIFKNNSGFNSLFLNVLNPRLQKSLRHPNN